MAINDNNITSENFWLNIGAEVIYNSLQLIKDAVDRLQKTIVWIFGVYTSISFASVLFSDKKDWNTWALVLFGIAFMFLIIAYWLATVAAFPTPEDFYGSAVDSIKIALNKALKKNRLYFNWAIALSGIGSFFYSIALLIQFSSPAWLKVKPTTDTNIPIVLKGMKMVHTLNSYTFNLTSKKNTWHELILIHDTIIKNKLVEDTVALIIGSNLKSSWIFTDTTGIARFTLKDIKTDKGNYLLVFRTDSIKSDQLVNTQRLKYKIN